MIQIFLLLVVFQVKHFLADFPLQGRYMLGKFKTGTEWILPLALHSMVHMTFTYWIVFLFTKDVKLSMAIGFLDFCVHFLVDRIKASPHLLGRFKPEQPYFWWALGADQMAHHLTHYLIIYFMVTK